MLLKILPLLLRYGGLLTKYAKYLPVLFSLITTAESVIGAGKGGDKKNLVLALLRVVIEQAASFGFITDDDATELIEGLVALMNVVGDLPKKPPATPSGPTLADLLPGSSPFAVVVPPLAPIVQPPK